MSPIDFSRAQDLLIKLVQVLSPLTVRAIPASFFLNKRFFIPPSQAEFKHMEMRSQVRLLTNLTAVQKEMGEWLEEATTAPPKPERQEPKQEHRGKKLSNSTKNEKPMAKETRENPLNRSETKPVSKQAQKLIAQVHEAIAKLTSSSYFKDPQEAPLREALKKIKPHLDKIIETVSLEDTIEENRPGFSRSSPPKSSREHIFSQLSKAIAKAVPSEKVSSSKNKPAQAEKTKEKRPPEEKKSDQPTRSNSMKTRENKVQVVNILTGKILVTQEAREESAPKPVERTYLPGAPYQPQHKNTSPTRRKKKRKGFWFKEEEEKRDHSD